MEAQLRQKFRQLDAGGKGYLDAADISTAFSSRSQTYPKAGSRMLIRLFSQQATLQFDQFCKLNAFIVQQMQIYRAFQQNNRMTDEQFFNAIASMGFDQSPDTITALHGMALQVFESSSIGLLEFQFISVFLHLAAQLFAEWNRGGDGILHIGPERMLYLLMWFL